ncbi:MAG TPA: ribosomal-processing cysteine protease Prp [Spirochaetota bacterium]|nr:ribosomal-processing cysteine protease Prp [Spirochaetota bacterium]HOS31580.1 ribosomal-processing cysteine protease Prp [Spirochaetota bacterium]HOS54767.1 ribosomal-processing cysteine protease Prp [Spirochaetota bacterium]HPK61918.1 ribosomal-processing cysteine protease Prp [Spirochaetota bacterium]HQF77431.1 ribosomal-processing cysteine protease Prp [Spirochaetota bacterium]
MIGVTVEIDDKDIVRQYSVKGHGGFDDIGRDIVCSAVSVLSLTSCLSIRDVVGENIEIEDDVDFFYKVGYYKSEDCDLLKGISLFLLNGLIEISKKYREYIDLRIVRS